MTKPPENQKDVSQLKEYFSSLTEKKETNVAEQPKSLPITSDLASSSESKPDKQKGSILKRLAAKFSPKMSQREVKEDSGSNESSQKTDQTDDHDDASTFSDRFRVRMWLLTSINISVLKMQYSTTKL